MEWLLSDYGSFSHPLGLAPVSYWQIVFLVMWLISNLFHELQRPVWTPHMWTINLIAATLMRKWLAVAGGRVPSTSDRMLGVTCLVCLEPEATFGSGNHPKHFETKAWFVHVCPNILHCYIAGFFFLGFLGISLLEKDSISLRAWDWQLALGSFHQVHGCGVSSPSAG